MIRQPYCVLTTKRFEKMISIFPGKYNTGTTPKGHKNASTIIMNHNGRRSTILDICAHYRQISGCYFAVWYKPKLGGIKVARDAIFSFQTNTGSDQMLNMCRFWQTSLPKVTFSHVEIQLKSFHLSHHNIFITVMLGSKAESMLNNQVTVKQKYADYSEK